MIKHWYITGDIHGKVPTSKWESVIDTPFEESAIILLGDAGFNYYLGKRDNSQKFVIQADLEGLTVYCVYGNHEERPENVPGMKFAYDENVDGMVYYEEEYPNLKYFCIWGVYQIAGYKTLVLGGAYSVDKEYRLINHWQWFSSEQMSSREKGDCFNKVERKAFDLVLSHTCPYSWQPFDLFLQGIDQSTVDNSMELWMEKFQHKITYDVWLFGHFHDDRLVRPHVEMFYTKIEDLNIIYESWIADPNL